MSMANENPSPEQLKQPLVNTEILAWPGLGSNQYLSGKFASEQNNAQCLIPGALSVRKGLKKLSFTSEPNAAANNIISMYHFQRHDVELVVYEDASGNLRAGRNPS